MAYLVGKNISLRALEPSDLDFLFKVENDERYWAISNTLLPYSKQVLRNYIQNAQQDIYDAKQYRFVICTADLNQIGMIDLFEFDPKNKRVGIGILILPDYQSQGLGSEALSLIVDYVFRYLNLHQVFANIAVNNKKSRLLFEKHGFILCGTKKDWSYTKGVFNDELMYQLIRPKSES